MTLTAYMTAKKLDDEAMARLIGNCSAFAVKKWRYRERMPRPDYIARIAKITKGAVTANDFHAAMAA